MGILLPDSVHHRLHRHIAAKVDDLEAVVLEDDADDVLADVVDIALDGSEDDAALAGPGPAPLGDGSLDLFKGGLCGAGGLQQLGQEEPALLVLFTHDVQRRDEGLVHQCQGLVFVQQGVGAGGGLTLEALFHRLHQRGKRAAVSCICLRRGV